MLAHSTLIGIVAASGAGLLLSLLILYRCLRRPRQQAPLPPKQELARYRNTVVQPSRPTWYDSGKLSTPPSAFAGSRSSLMPPDSRGGSPGPFRHPSFNTSESPSDETSFDAPPLPLAVPLQLPNLSFDTSSTSLSTAETDSPPLASASDSSFSRRQPSSSSRPSRRPRPLSVGSAGSSAVSRNSRNTIRGVPHGPHSQVQIVLPAPLAFNDRLSIHERSYGVVDQWAPAAVRSSEPHPIPRPLSSSGPRRSSSHSSIAPRRPASTSSLPRSPSSRHSPVPPVPQLPQQIVAGATVIADSERGRPRDVSADRTPAPSDRPPPTKLRRRSQSRGR
ncbi:hypothetical protein C8F01DRAFT_1109817 [Mycena amicta]|nr:hypothetical protein C8F01DRAFT_1109817 [Mycena amicta]